MKAKDNKLLKLLDGNDKRFVIPVYQRQYTWKKEHCIQLWEDLENVFDYKRISHFFGSIVYVARGVGNYMEYIIIDGQQRITTISLLLLAIRNYIKENGEISGIEINKINNYLMDNYNENDSEKKLKLKLVQGDDDAYDKLVNELSSVADNRVYANYEYFYSQLEKSSSDKIKGIYDALDKLIIVSVTLDQSEGDDPHLVFESMKSPGQALEESDKIRNFVLMGMVINNQEDLYKKHWEPLEKTVEEIDINKFFRYYLDVKLRKNVSEKKLYTEFKGFVQNNDKSIESILLDINKYAKYYREILKPEEKNSFYLKELLKIKRLEVNTCIPLIMDVLNAVGEELITKEDALLVIQIIENYIVRREICGLETNQLNKIFVGLGSEIEKDISDNKLSYIESFKKNILKKTGKARFPSNADFKEHFLTYELYNAKPAIKKYILEQIENSTSKERVDVEGQIKEGTLTIEHVMPQTLNNEWVEALGERWDYVHTKYLDTPGNLTLTAYNSEYSNLSFDKKKNMPGKGFIHSKLLLNEYIKTCNKWTEEEIINRATILYSYAEKIWWKPQNSSIISNDDEWIDWDEEIELTNKIIDYIYFLGNKEKVSKVTDVYKIIHTKLYDYDPICYHKNSFIWFADKENELKKPFRIGKDGYIELKDITDRMIFESIKEMAAKMDFSSNEIMYSVKRSFSIEDESTYNVVTVGKMAYELIKYLIENDLLSENEIKRLKTKEYSKKLFDRTDYPVLANNKTDNKGKSDTIRYRKNPVKYKGKDIYITTQWFDPNRIDIINWFKKHRETTRES